MNCTTPENNLLSAWMPKQKPYSFRPDAPLQERVQKILDATGLSGQVWLLLQVNDGAKTRREWVPVENP